MVVAIIGAVALTALPVRAQDPVDSLPSIESADSVAIVEDSTDAVSTVRRHPIRDRRGGNPYLREVREPRQSAFRRGRFWASAGLGAGGEAVATLGAPGPYTAARVRPTLSAGFGTTIGQQLRLGLDGFAWFNVTNAGALETITAGLIGARVYPFPSSGLYLRTGAGFGRYGQDLTDDCGCSEPLVQDWGFAWMLGGGYEIPVSRGLWIGPSVEMLRMNVTGPDGYRERVLNIGVTLTFDGND